MRHHLVDTTLRDGEQAPGVVLTQAARLSIARALVEAGVPELEVGIPAMGRDVVSDIRAVVRLAGCDRVVTWARASEEDIASAAETGAGALHLSFPASILHQSLWRTSPAEILEKVSQLVRAARKDFSRVYIGAQDASRANAEYLIELALAARQAGASRFRIADTVGVLTPTRTHRLLEEVRRGVPDIELEFHAHNDLGLATANTLAAFEAGAHAASVTVNGLGERAGNAALEEVVVALRVTAAVDCGIDCGTLTQLSELVARVTKRALAPQKPIVGSAVFQHESGLHCAGLLRDPRSYEPFPPELVGRTRAPFVLGSHTGGAAVRHVLAELGINVDLAAAKALAGQIRSIVRRRGISMTAAELRALAPGESHPLAEAI